MNYRACLACKFNIFHSILPFETCKPASTSKVGLTFFLTLAKHDSNFFGLQSHNNVILYTFYQSPSHESTNLDFQLFHSCITHYSCYFSPFWNDPVYRSVNFLYLFRMYHIIDSLPLNSQLTTL